MASFNYGWWTIDIVYEGGCKYSTEFKGKTKDSVIRQIRKFAEYCNSEENLSKPVWLRKQRVLSVEWDTLKLDRTGYQRLS